VKRLEIPSHATVDTKLDLIIDGHNSLVDGFNKLNAKVGNLDKRMDNLEIKVKILETKVEILETKVDNLEKKVDSLEKKVDKLGKDLDLKTFKIMSYLTHTLGTWADQFERFCSRMVQKRFPQLNDVSISETIEDEELDIFSQDPLFIGECTLKLVDLKKVEHAVRKKKAIEKLYRKPCLTVLFANQVETELVQVAENACEKEGIILIHGMKFQPK
jgi:chromosome segregation ATPase